MSDSRLPFPTPSAPAAFRVLEVRERIHFDDHRTGALAWLGNYLGSEPVAIYDPHYHQGLQQPWPQPGQCLRATLAPGTAGNPWRVRLGT